MMMVLMVMSVVFVLQRLVHCGELKLNNSHERRPVGKMFYMLKVHGAI